MEMKIFLAVFIAVHVPVRLCPLLCTCMLEMERELLSTKLHQEEEKRASKRKGAGVFPKDD